jgi:hypothetical protein
MFGVRPMWMAASAADALDKLPRWRPDVVISEWGPELAGAVRRDFPDVGFVLLAEMMDDSIDDWTVDEAIDSGASVLIARHALPGQLVRAATVAAAPGDFEVLDVVLTELEKRALPLWLDPRPRIDLAGRLGVSPRIATRVISSMLAKLGTNDPEEIRAMTRFLHAPGRAAPGRAGHHGRDPGPRRRTTPAGAAPGTVLHPHPWSGPTAGTPVAW